MQHRTPRTVLLASIIAMALMATGTSHAQTGLLMHLKRVFLPPPFERAGMLQDSLAMAFTSLDTSREASLARLDSIFLKALEITEGDMEESLFISAISTIPYKSFLATLPVLGGAVSVPVSFESAEAFLLRREHLPTHLLRASPREGDRDKLPHFFGSAWLQLRLRNPAVARSLGYGVEVFERMFFLEGAFDDRDIDANILGIAFAEALMRERNVLPSRMWRGR